MRTTVRTRLLSATLACALLGAACTSSSARDDTPEPSVEAASPGASRSEPADEDSPVGAASETVEPGQPLEPADPGNDPDDQNAPTSSPSTSEPTTPSTDPPSSEDPDSTGGDPGADAKLPAAPGARGVTDDTIVLGVEYHVNAQESRQQFGLSLGDPGDTRRFNEVMREHINATGGIAGRTLEVVYHEMNTQSGKTASVHEQESCATFTEDNEVFAAKILNYVNTAFHTDGFRHCLQDGGVASFSTVQATGLNDAGYEVFNTFVDVNALSLDAAAIATVDGLARAGHFDDARVGLVSIDMPRYRQVVDETMKPALADHGQQILEERYITPPQNESELGGTSAQISSAVLRFKSVGITHVIIFEAGGGLWFLFSTNAESQDYRPAYRLNTLNGLQAYAEGGNIPDGQLPGTTFAGWMPIVDVYEHPSPERAEECIEIYEAANEDITGRTMRANALSQCDAYLFFREAVEASGRIDQLSVARGAERLAAGFRSSLAERTVFGPDRHWGPGTYRIGRYDTDCACFRYTSETFPAR